MAGEEEIIECPVPGCGVQYRNGAMSNLRSKVCNAHQKMDCFPIDGVDHRYCHQCYKLHPLDQIIGNKRSCTLRLERHNLRRRLNRLYKKSCTKEGPPDSEAGSFKPDRNKAAVDLVWPYSFLPIEYSIATCGCCLSVLQQFQRMLHISQAKL